MADIDLHDKIVSELFTGKSAAAFIWLIRNGRELEFSYQGHAGFISKSGSGKYVSLWIGKQEQSFASAEQLLENAVLIDGTPILDAWNRLQLSFLY